MSNILEHELESGDTLDNVKLDGERYHFLCCSGAIMVYGKHWGKYSNNDEKQPYVEIITKFDKELWGKLEYKIREKRDNHEIPIYHFNRKDLEGKLVHIRCQE